MKTLVILMMSVFALSSQASSYSCKEIYDVRSDAHHSPVTVDVTELRASAPSNQGYYYDNAYEVLVSLKSNQVSSTTVVKTFKAQAIAADVLYTIDSKATNFKMRMYLNDLDRSEIEYFVGGVKTKVKLNCIPSYNR